MTDRRDIPPDMALALLERFCKPALFDEIAGDLCEQFHHRRKRMSRGRARLLFWKDALLFLRPFAFGPDRRPTNTAMMWKNYLKTAARHMWRQKIYAGVNVLGLTVGIACGLLAALFVMDELSYDRFHENGDRVFRLGTDLTAPDGLVRRFNASAWPVGVVIEENVPGIEDVVHLRHHEGKVSLGEQFFFEDLYYAEDGFFDLFSFPLISGDAGTALRDPYSVVFTTEAAERIFGTRDVVGRSVVLLDTLSHVVTGVVEMPPARTHVEFDGLVSYSTWEALERPSYTERWFDMNMYHYAIVEESADPAQVAERVATVYDDHAGAILSDVGYSGKVVMDNVGDVYLRADRFNMFGPRGDIRYVYLIAGIGLIMVLVAAINFVNLSTARSLERAREVGLRKVVGSSRGMIVQQFLGEAGLTGMIALVLGGVLAALALPYFNALTQRDHALEQLLTPEFALLALGLGVIVTVAAGFYPALVMARHRPVDVLKGSAGGVVGGVRLRQGLVVVQYAISCVLILGALAGYRQIEHMRSADLGFDVEQVLVVQGGPVGYQRMADRASILRGQLMGRADVVQVTHTAAVPGRSGWPSIMVFPEGRSQDDGMTLEYIAADAHFVQTFGLELAAGRDFDPNRPSDEDETLLINEAAVVALGFGTPAEAVGKYIQAPNRNAQGTVVGVLKDYHHHGLQQEVRPIVYGISPYPRYVAIRARTGAMAGLAPEVQAAWEQLFPGYGFNYFFLDEGYDEQYQTEARLTRVFVTFALLSVLISCLGLFGLSAFTISRRTREIGVRKVLGATSGGIVGRVSREFVALVGVAFLVAVPIGWFVLDRWLSGFAYRISLGPGLFVLTGLLAVSVAVLTVGYHAYRAAAVEPARALRYE